METTSWFLMSQNRPVPGQSLTVPFYLVGPHARGMKKKAAAYQRVSRGEQSLENQRPATKRLIRARKLQLITTFEESASAANARPQFAEMMASAHRSEFNVLVVWSLDRLGRSMAGNLQSVLALDRCGVEVVSVQGPWLDTGGARPCHPERNIPLQPSLTAVLGDRLTVLLLGARTPGSVPHMRYKIVRAGDAETRCTEGGETTAFLATALENGWPRLDLRQHAAKGEQRALALSRD